MIDDRDILPTVVITDWGGATTREEVPAAAADKLAKARRALPGVVSVQVKREPVAKAKATRMQLEYDEAGQLIGILETEE